MIPDMLPFIAPLEARHNRGGGVQLAVSHGDLNLCILGTPAPAGSNERMTVVRVSSEDLELTTFCTSCQTADNYRDRGLVNKVGVEEASVGRDGDKR